MTLAQPDGFDFTGESGGWNNILEVAVGSSENADTITLQEKTSSFTVSGGCGFFKCLQGDLEGICETRQSVILMRKQTQKGMVYLGSCNKQEAVKGCGWVVRAIG